MNILAAEEYQIINKPAYTIKVQRIVGAFLNISPPLLTLFHYKKIYS